MSDLPTGTIIDCEPLLPELANALGAWLSHHGRKDAALVGIKTGGAWLCDRLVPLLPQQPDVGYLDIAFYRDDFSTHGLHPNVTGSDLRFDVDNRHIVLVDDVILSGRTIRAALNALFDYGRPASVVLLTLYDLNQRELPIAADICASRLSLDAQKRVKLRGPHPLTAEIVCAAAPSA